MNYKISKKHHSKYDISFCCNVLLHLPNIEIPLKKLINTSKKHAIRGIVDNILISKTGSQNYDELSQDIIFEKLSSEISKDVQKIVHLRKVAIRKFKLIKISPVSDDNNVEKQTIDPLTT